MQVIQKCKYTNKHRQLRTKWQFRTVTIEDLSTTPEFCPKSNWTHSLGHPKLDIFVRELGKELFENSNFRHFHQRNFSREEWKFLRDLAEESTVTKSANTG